MLVSLISSIDQTISVQTPGVNFINILQAAFTGEDPKSAKKYSKVVSLLCAFGICAH